MPRMQNLQNQGVVYGKYSEAGVTPISVNDLEKKMSDNKFDGKIQGKWWKCARQWVAGLKFKRKTGTTGND
jgi:hypothetical protein